MEVVTPALGLRGATDPHIQSMRVVLDGTSFFLQASPEFAMKRLLATGVGAIYQICPAFRAGESGIRHNPEFTLLEWYRPGFGLDALMHELGVLLGLLCEAFDVEFELAQTATYRQLFEDRFGINPHRATVEQLSKIADTHYGELAGHIDAVDEGRIDDIRDLLFSSGIEPRLEAPRFVTGFPASQAALARIGNVDEDDVALRFELFWRGLELANGYDELKNGQELIRRIERDNRIRQSRKLGRMEIDEELLEAMTAMPDCSGVAVGLDRLLMLLTGKSSLRDVISFTIDA